MVKAKLVDISFYQSDPQTAFAVNFEKMATQTDAVICRAGQNTWPDREFADYWKRSKGVLPRGSYWFYDSRAEPKAQAELWVKTLGNDLGELPMFGDFEDIYGGKFHGWRHWYTFIERVKALVPGKEFGIYTGFYYWKENTRGVQISNESLAYFKQYALWIANYGTDAPLIPEPWTDWLIWQTGDDGDGRAHGVESLNIDVNVFNGALEDFRARFRLNDAPSNGGEGEPTMQYRFAYFDKTANRAVRSGAGVTYPRVLPIGIPGTVVTAAGYITAGSIAEGDELVTLAADVRDANGAVVGKAGDQWLHVRQVGGYKLDGFTAVKHLGALVGNLTDRGEVTETPVGGEDVIVNVDTEKRVISVSTESGADWAVYVDGLPYVKA